MGGQRVSQAQMGSSRGGGPGASMPVTPRVERSGWSSGPGCKSEAQDRATNTDGRAGVVVTQMTAGGFSLDEKHTVCRDTEPAELCPANLDRLMQSRDSPVTFLTETCFRSALSKAAPPHSPTEARPGSELRKVTGAKLR